MNSPKSAFLALLCAAFIIGGAGCATRPPAPHDGAATAAPAPGTVLRSLPVDRAVAARILALDPERISDSDVRNTLEKRIRDPRDASWSYSPYDDSARLAGIVAWHYEHDGMPPMLIGHSQGGIQAVKVLDELAGQFDPSVRVWNPVTDAAEDRVTIVDPLTGHERTVIGITITYASAVGAGGAALLLPNQWSMIGRLWKIPDTVGDFTGYEIALDLIAWTVGSGGGSAFRPNGSANVRNVSLPAGYSHVTIPVVQALADHPAAREWINAYHPGDKAAPEPPGEEGYAMLWAADVWYDVKKHWCLEAQRLVRAQTAAPAAGLP